MPPVLIFIIKVCSNCAIIWLDQCFHLATHTPGYPSILFFEYLHSQD